MTATLEKTATLNIVRAGADSREPIVLLHSAGLDLTYWDHQFASLGAEYSIVAVDLPGHGGSPGGPKLWREGRIADAVAAAFATLDVDGLHLVGMSLGGMIAQRLTLDRPDLVRSLVLIDTGARFEDGARAAMHERAAVVRSRGIEAVREGLLGHWFTAATLADRPDLVLRVTQTLARQNAEVHASMWEFIADFDISEEIAAIGCPTLVVVGEHDPSSPIATARALRDTIPGAALRMVPNVAHLSALERPDAIGRLIAGHVARAT